MKRLGLIFVLLFSAAAWAGDPNPADYAITVHVISSRIIPPGGLRLKVTIDGKKYELEGNPGPGVLAPGNYKAKLTQDSGKNSYDIQQTYELLFPDKKTRKYWVAGISE